MGNIKGDPAYDPFPKSGLVKQYEPFIRDYVHDFCKRYPGLNRQRVLFRAVEIALAAEKAFKPALGHSFATYAGHRLKELHRLHDEDEAANSSPIHYADGELERDRAEERGEEVELDFSGGNNGARLTFDLQWYLLHLCSDIVNWIGWRAESPTLKSRHRVAAGVQLRGGDNAPAVHQRISADLPEVVREQPVGATLKGWIRAIFDHNIRRQREADDEAEKRVAGDHSPTFLEAVRNAVDIRFAGARRPPRYLQKRTPHASLDASMDDKSEGGNDAPQSLHDIVGGGTDAGNRLDDLHDKAQAILPRLKGNERLVFEALLTGDPTTTQRDIARATGLTEGTISKTLRRIAVKARQK